MQEDAGGEPSFKRARTDASGTSQQSARARAAAALAAQASEQDGDAHVDAPDAENGAAPQSGGPAAQDARARALAAMAAQRSADPEPAEPDPLRSAEPPNGAPAVGARERAAQLLQAQPPGGAPAGARQDGAATNGATADGGAEEFAGGAEDFADDVGPSGAAGFPFEQADLGQDLDHLLPAAERNWENTRAGEALPPGWAKCPNMGDEVFQVFTPIKAPMAGGRARRIPEVYQFTPDMLVAEMKRRGRLVGVVVDLTATTKYYDPEKAFKKQGIVHVKLRSKGHGEVPPPLVVNTFYWEVRKHLMMLQAQWQSEKQWLAQYDEEVRQFEAERKGQHPKDKARPPEQAAVLRDRELVEARPRAIVVHCTHGFNRSGYCIVHCAMRTNTSLAVADCLREFAKARSPGIYKDDYIQALFAYYHEERPDFGPHAVETPLVPAWKPDDGSPEHFDAVERAAAAAEDAKGKGPMKHDDNFGEDICEEEAAMYRREVLTQLKLGYMQRHEGGGSGGLPAARAQHAMRNEFPGSQPVSLSSENWGLLSKLRYWFTWKADGTRYMLYLSHSGTYLIDRRMKISRVQMRFPLWSRPGVATATPAAMLAWFKLFDAGKLPKPQRVDPRRIELHHGTLLDGEMVVNDHPDGRQERVFYAYDLMMLQGVNVAARPWKRFMLIREVVDPMRWEGAQIADAARGWPRRYDYAAQPFAVQLKEFWPLHRLAKVQSHFVPTLLHENDGLILQSYEAEYRPEASADILKWKPASHNSVDFTLLPVEHDAVMADPRCLDAADARNQLYFLGVYSRREVVVAYDVKAGAGGVLQPTETPARVEFDNAQEDPAQYVGMVIECTYDAKTGVWHFMRERSKDKDTPNALATYHKVMISIFSAIDEKDIAEQFDIAYTNGGAVYQKDLAALAREKAEERKGRAQGQQAKRR